MFLRRLKRSYEKNRSELLGLTLGRYPRFVRRNVAPESVPAFQFHDVETARLDELLGFLHRNDYKTLSADEFHAIAMGQTQADRHSVLLTFDDGRRSLYQKAFPLLQRYEQKAVAYIVPGRIPDKEIDQDLCTWPEIREMHASGLVDMQSHSTWHHSVAVSGRIVDFSRPGLETSFLESDLSPLGPPLPGAGGFAEDDWGSPVFEWGARMGAAPAVLEPAAGVNACRELVRMHGGADFFAAPDWYRRLLHCYRSATPERPEFESAEIQAEAITADLIESRQRIEQQLPGHKVRHFCFPWYRGSRLATDLSSRAGLVTNAWGSMLPGFIKADESDPLPIARLAPRYIRRLPGDGRLSLHAVLKCPH